VSSRRKTSLVLALGVAALAGTSLAAMVATSELLVESFGRPVSGRLDPPLPDLGRPRSSRSSHRNQGGPGGLGADQVLLRGARHRDGDRPRGRAGG
jgi:hypothetical protein